MRWISITFLILTSFLPLEAVVLNKRDSVDYMGMFNSVRLRSLDSAELVAQLAIDQGLDKGDSLLFLRASTAMAWVLEQRGDYIGAISNYEKALNIAYNNDYRARVKFILNRLGLTHSDFDNYSESLKYHLQSLKLREEDGDLAEIASAMNNIGLVYYRIGDYDLAIQYYETALELNERTNTDLKFILVNLGLCYSAIGLIVLALFFFEKVIELCEEGCNPEISVEAYNGLGLSYLNQDFDKARFNLKESIKISEKNDITFSLVQGLHNLSRVELLDGKIELALELVNESQDIALVYGYKRWIKSNFQQLGSIYSSLENYELAYKYQRKYDSLNGDILNEGIVKNMAKIQADYQQRENLQTIEDQDQEISRRNTLLLLSVIIILLISIILFILYRINQLRKKANRQLAEAKRTIEQQNNVLEEKVKERTKELAEANAALMKSNTDLDNFIYKTSHDIRGPLATLQGMCNVALIDIQDQKSIDYFEKIGKTAYRLNEILSKLLIINQINNSLIANHKVELKELTADIIREQSTSPNYADIKVENTIEAPYSIESDEVLLKIILGNLVSNAF